MAESYYYRQDDVTTKGVSGTYTIDPRLQRLSTTTAVLGASNQVEEKPGIGEDRNSSTIKLDGNKAPVFEGFFSYFPKAIVAVTQVSAFGAKKYNKGIFPTKWKDVPNGVARYTNALGRHLLDEACGELYANDSNLLHAAHLAWNALARLEKIIEAEEAKEYLDKLETV